MSKIARRRRRRNGGLLRFSHHRRPVSRKVRRAIAEDNRDRPLYLGWQPKDFEALAPLELPKPRKRITQLAQAQIISAALVNGREDHGRWISYSRSCQFYNDVRDRYGETYSYKLVVPTVDALTQAGWLENDRKPPGHYGEQSRMRATERLLTALENVEVVYAPRESLLCEGTALSHFFGAARPVNARGELLGRAPSEAGRVAFGCAGAFRIGLQSGVQRPSTRRRISPGRQRHDPHAAAPPA